VRFTNVIGQHALKKQLIKTVNAGHVGHALMFLGSEGSGNLAMAIAFAGYILCENPGETDRCGICPACKKLDVLGHPDLHFSFPIVIDNSKKTCEPFLRTFIETVKEDPYLTLSKWEQEVLQEKKKALIPAEEANHLVKNLSLKSFSHGHKITIMWMAEKMNSAAANKLLKTFEEPTDKTITILVTNSTDAMLATVISRTQLVTCERLSEEEVAEALCTLDGADRDLAKIVAWQAEGDYAKARRILGKDDDSAKYLETFSRWMRACVKSNLGVAMQVSEELASLKKEDQQRFLEYCLQFLHESILYVFAGAEHARFDQNALAFAERFAPFMAQSGLSGFHEVFSTGHYHVERNANAQLLFMHMSNEMMKLFANPKPELIS
jgi:DNA polymerase-3 subunit delta'